GRGAGSTCPARSGPPRDGGEVIGLEQAVLTYYPGDLVGDIGFQDGRRHLPMPVGGEPVADVMEEGGDYVLLAFTGSGRSRRSLQRMFVAGHLVAVERISLLLPVLPEPVGELGDIVQLQVSEELVVLACPILHPREANCLHRTPPFLAGCLGNVSGRSSRAGEPCRSGLRP